MHKLTTKKILKNLSHHPRLVIIALILSIITAASSNNESSIKGDIRIIDGDTIVLNNEKIRLQGIDAPETKQYCKAEDKKTKIPCGKIATEKLKEIIDNNKVTCNIKGTDRYSRKLGYCYAGDININKEMVRRGYAVAYIQYDKSFAQDESVAKKEKLGFWNGTFERPQDWRKKSKQSRKKKNTKSQNYLKNVGGIEKVDFLCGADIDRSKRGGVCSEKSKKEINAIKDEYINYRKILEDRIAQKRYNQFNEKANKNDSPLDINKLAIAMYDINGDGEKEILINNIFGKGMSDIFGKGSCGSASCAFEILKKDDQGEWSKLIMPLVHYESIYISKNTTKSGYRDFIFQDGWGERSVWHIWRWNGRKYDFYKKIYDLTESKEVSKKKITPTIIKFKEIKEDAIFSKVLKEKFPTGLEGEKALDAIRKSKAECVLVEEPTRVNDRDGANEVWSCEYDYWTWSLDFIDFTIILYLDENRKILKIATDRSVSAK